jgi:hypothetical protein
MTFEFDYNTETEQITIVYDGSFVLNAQFDSEKPVFKNFDKIQDEEIEHILKSLCKNMYSALA